MKKQLIFLIIFNITIISTLISIPKNNELNYSEQVTHYEYFNVYYDSHKRNTLDLTLPKNNTNGLILFIHGGSWLSGDKEVYKNNLLEWTINKRFAACAINYHYAYGMTNYEDILNDISNALSRVKQLAEHKNIILTKVLLTGHSAGGHLSLLYAYSRIDNSPIKPACVVNLSGPTDLNDINYFSKNPLKIGYIFSSLTNRIITTSNYTKKYNILKNVSPINYITNNTVPTLTGHGTKDTVVPYSNAIKLHQILNQNNVINDLIEFPNSNHGLESDQNKTEILNKLMYEYAIKYLS